ncbi:hypothetical protein BT67DRAFT_440050 [Trichocladium antarcticum]|uniref:Uncharacterized protein n=1 Tax=Trichocladium antarcticum TaxID=1450529 RepID=A0AAN6UQE5_9PEZI|nr:hypothetical protein BT67DRAFT_440050 [Trichocladium antarcticum]
MLRKGSILPTVIEKRRFPLTLSSFPFPLLLTLPHLKHSTEPHAAPILTEYAVNIAVASNGSEKLGRKKPGVMVAGFWISWRV